MCGGTIIGSTASAVPGRNRLLLLMTCRCKGNGGGAQSFCVVKKKMKISAIFLCFLPSAQIGCVVFL